MPAKGFEVRQLEQLQAAFAGKPVGEIVPSTTRGLSPNQNAMAVVLEYAAGDAGPLLAWLLDQARSFMRREIAGYRGYYAVPMAVARRLAWERRDEWVYRHVLRWWMTYVALCERCQVNGRVYIPGPRQGNPHDQGPWNEPRDLNLAILTGRREINVNRFGKLQTEPYIATIMLQHILDTGLIPPLPAPNDAYLPNFRDPLRIQRWSSDRLAVSVESFWPEGWPEDSIPPIEGAPFWSVVAEGDQVIDAVSWRSYPGLKWDDVVHANVAGYVAPRPPAIPAAWGAPHWEVLLGESGTVPPLPPLPSNWPTSAPPPAPPPTKPVTPPPPPSPRHLTSADVDRMTASQLLDLMATDHRRDTWGGAYLKILRRAAKELISAGIELPVRTP